ncbi:hypothetical protein LTS18_008073, partial [Coniosporium uncinatum]
LMLPTPSTSHVSFDNVYEPAEDSFLLLNTLSSEKEKAFLRQRFRLDASSEKQSPSPLILEVGTGSGVVLAFVNAHANTLFGRSDLLTLGTDINSLACKAAAKTVEKAQRDIRSQPEKLLQPGIFLDVCNANLTTPLRLGSVDVLIFNPPYVPTEELPDLKQHALYNNSDTVEHTTTFERDSHLLALSYAGGADGMEVTDRLLEHLPNTLSPQRGVAYILLCAQNKPETVKQRIRAWPGGWQAETVGHSGKQGGWEKLQIIRIWRAAR